MARAPFTTNGDGRNRQGSASPLASDVHHSLQADAEDHHSTDDQGNQIGGRPREWDNETTRAALTQVGGSLGACRLRVGFWGGIATATCLAAADSAERVHQPAGRRMPFAANPAGGRLRQQS
jgi:hypothetical protein